MKFLLLVFIYEAHGFASESSVWVLFSYTVTHTTQQSWNDTTTCRTLTIFIFKNVYFLTRSEVSGVNEATFRDDSLKWITRISSCLGAWDTFLFFSSSLSFFSYSGHTWLVNCMMCDDVWVFAPNSHWPVLSRREGGEVTDTPHAHFPPLCFFVRVNEREWEHLIQRKHSGNLRRWLTTVKFQPPRENPLQNRAVKDRENKRDQPLKAEGLGFSYVRFYFVISCPVSL